MATTSESRVQSKKKVKNVKSYNKSNIPAVFIMPQSLPSDFIDGKLNGQEIKRAVETALHLDEDNTEIECVQRCNGVFKIFFSNHMERRKLLISGVAIRGVHITVYGENPLSIDGQDAVRLRISNIDYLTSDIDVINAIKNQGITIVSDLMYESYRYDIYGRFTKKRFCL